MFSARLFELIQKYEIDYVLPLSEDDCLPISIMAQQGTLGAVYLGNDHPTLTLAMNKPKCYRALQAAGIGVPEFYELDSIEDLVEKAHRLGYPEKALVLRPKSGRGSRGFRLIDAAFSRMAALAEAGPQVRVDLELLCTYFLEEPARICDYFVSEFLTGALGGADIVAFRGETLAAFPAFPKDGKWGAYSHVKLQPHKDMSVLAQKCVSTLALHGLCNVEAGYASDGTLRVIEVNPRTSATVHQNSLVGPNNLDMLLRAINGDIGSFEQTAEATYRLYPSLIEVTT